VSEKFSASSDGSGLGRLSSVDPSAGSTPPALGVAEQSPATPPQMRRRSLEYFQYSALRRSLHPARRAPPDSVRTFQTRSCRLRQSRNRATIVVMLTRLCALLAFLPLALLGACSGSSNGAKCVPGLTVACPCPTGESGSQTCTSAGTFSACVCGTPLPDASEPPGQGGASGDSSVGGSILPPTTSAGGDTGGSVRDAASAGSGGIVGTGGRGGTGGTDGRDAPAPDGGLFPSSPLIDLDFAKPGSEQSGNAVHGDAGWNRPLCCRA
jgi:hypothetical protein